MNKYILPNFFDYKMPNPLPILNCNYILLFIYYSFFS